MEDVLAAQAIIVDRVAEQHRHHGKAQFFYVWGALLVFTGIEVYLGYQTGPGGMLFDRPVKMLSIKPRFSTREISMQR